MAPFSYSDQGFSASPGHAWVEFDSFSSCRSSAALLLDPRRTLETSARHRHGWRSKWSKRIRDGLCERQKSKALALGARGRGCPRGAEGAWSGPQPARAQGADLRWINPVPDSPVVYCLLGEPLEGAIRREPERSLARVIEIWSGAHWTEWVGRGESRGLRESRACTVERRVGRGAGGKPTPGSDSACTPDFNLTAKPVQQPQRRGLWSHRRRSRIQIGPRLAPHLDRA
jgi:hypothetical protein